MATSPLTLPGLAAIAPLALWTDFALKSSEMLVSSGQVIGTRVDRMLRAGPLPNARDRKEFLLMGSEKLKAANASGVAVATQLQSANLQLITQTWEQWFSTWQAMTVLGTSRSLAEVMTRQQAVLDAVSRAAPTQARLSGDMARLASAALAPVHAAARANASRLARVRRSKRAARR